MLYRKDRAIYSLLPVLALFAALAVLAAEPLPSAGRTFFDLADVRQLATAYTPDQIETAYNFKPLYSGGTTGTGQTIALIEVDTFDPNDIHQFDAAYGLQDPTVQQFYVGGRFTPENNGETTMDIEWAHALAPGAGIQVYYVRNNTSPKQGWKLLAAAVRQAMSHGAGSISMSLGTCSAGRASKVVQQAFAAALARGVSTFVSSGDDGAHPGPTSDCGNAIRVSYPGDDPSVVSVGGTSLSLNADGSIGSEVAWPRSGGGRGRPFLRPIWQIAATIPTDRYRWAPDVAFLGDPGTGVSIFLSGWKQAAGTSLGAPAWAAIWSLVREVGHGAVGAAPQYLYRIGSSAAYQQAFHDITQGQNAVYHAGPGWDPLTGLGTPDVQGLATAVGTLTARR